MEVNNEKNILSVENLRENWLCASDVCRLISDLAKEEGVVSKRLLEIIESLAWKVNDYSYELYQAVDKFNKSAEVEEAPIDDIPF